MLVSQIALSGNPDMRKYLWTRGETGGYLKSKSCCHHSQEPETKATIVEVPRNFSLCAVLT